MAKAYRLLLVGGSILLAKPALACEPVVPFIQVTVPALALAGSLVVLATAVLLKSVLFAVFEAQLPRLHAACRMFLGNVLTSFVGLLVAAMIGGAPVFWVIGVPLVAFLCWLPSRRLVKAAPLAWLAELSPPALAAAMAGAMVASCILFMFGRVAVETHELVLYWMIKLAAISLALSASITLTTV